VSVQSEWLEYHGEVSIGFALVILRYHLGSRIELHHLGVNDLANGAILGLENAVALNKQQSRDVAAARGCEAEVVCLREIETSYKVDKSSWDACANSFQGSHEIILVVIRGEVGEIVGAARAQIVCTDHDGEHFPIVLQVNIWVLVHLSNQIGDLLADHIDDQRTRLGRIVLLSGGIVLKGRAARSVADLCRCTASGEPNYIGVEETEEVGKCFSTSVSANAESTSI